MKATGFLWTLYTSDTNMFHINLKGAYLGGTVVDFELNQWYYLKIERRSTGHPDNKCSTTFHVNLNQIMEKITDCGIYLYSATETEVYASCAGSNCTCSWCDSVSGLVDSMRFVWL